MVSMPLIAVAHGTSDPDGPKALERLLDRVRRQLPEVGVRVAFVDVIGPTLAEVLADVDGRAVVVPLFLASGYHVRVDVPKAVQSTGGRAIVTPALGPHKNVIEAMADRLAEVGELPESVVMAAAGSSDASALGEVNSAAKKLSRRLGRDVVPAYVTTAEPSVPDAVAAERAAGARTIGIAPYLLAPGLFQRRLADAGADIVAEPIGPHEGVADLITERYRSCRHGQ
jgi:sirohydrochlorin ferrochelatase